MGSFMLPKIYDFLLYLQKAGNCQEFHPVYYELDGVKIQIDLIIKPSYWPLVV